VLSSVEVETGAKLFRLIVASLLGGVQDNKKSMRDSTIQALTVIVTLGRDKGPSEGTASSTVPSQAEPVLLSVFLPALIEALVNPVGRHEILQFVLNHIENVKNDCSDLVVLLVACMQDKTAAVRALAEQVVLGQLLKLTISFRPKFSSYNAHLYDSFKKNRRIVLL
jgi:hypothetical protein